MKPSLSLLTTCLLLGACSQTPPRDAHPVQPPPAWQSPHTQASQLSSQQWWSHFRSPALDRLIAQARIGSYDLAAAIARVQQARATAVIAGAPLLPEVKFASSANREKLLRGKGYSQLDATDNNKAVDSFDANLTASYEVDFWGGKAAARDSALHTLNASQITSSVSVLMKSGACLATLAVAP